MAMWLRPWKWREGADVPEVFRVKYPVGRSPLDQPMMAPDLGPDGVLANLAWLPTADGRSKFKEPPFELKDHDGPSMLWVNAYVLEDHYRLPGHAERLRELAVKWACEREAAK